MGEESFKVIYNLLSESTGGWNRRRGVFLCAAGRIVASDGCSGRGDSNKSNAHTLDRSGNAWFAGTVKGTAIILKFSMADSTKRFKITVNDSGTLTATEIPE